ncbi:MAG: acyltransferase [Clostridia bacterium]|nr:acyltransferase [Clostridia bacterium]
MAEKRNTSIQLLRICACAMVFIVHFGQRVGFSGVLKNFTDFGQFGVQLFFLISGFLAYKTFFENPNTNIWKYYKKRMVAILPLYYLVIIYYFISENVLNCFVDVIPADQLGIGWLRYVFLLNGFINSETYFWSNLGITWTIPVFMFFYLIAPWILRKVKSIISACSIWFLVFVTTQIINVFYTCTIISNLHVFFLGAVIYVFLHEKREKIAFIFLLLASICMIILGEFKNAYTFIFACLILSLNSIDNICLPKWLQNLVDTIDKYSYTLYLTHGVVFCSVIDRLNALGVSKILIAILAVLGTVVATWLVGKYIEKPIQKFLKNIL